LQYVFLKTFAVAGRSGIMSLKNGHVAKSSQSAIIQSSLQISAKGFSYLSICQTSGSADGHSCWYGDKNLLFQWGT